MVFQRAIWKEHIKAALLYWVYLPALVLGSGKFIDIFMPLQLPVCPYTGAAMIIVGGIIIWRATVDLTSYGKGTPSPFRPPTLLVTEGVYKLCRHPMWLGYDFMALGVILLIGSLGSLLISFPVFLVGQIAFLVKEEKILTAKFKQRYSDYQRKTGMLAPLFHISFKKGGD